MVEVLLTSTAGGLFLTTMMIEEVLHFPPLVEVDLSVEAEVVSPVLAFQGMCEFVLSSTFFALRIQLFLRITYTDTRPQYLYSSTVCTETETEIEIEILETFEEMTSKVVEMTGAEAFHHPEEVVNLEEVDGTHPLWDAG